MFANNYRPQNVDFKQQLKTFYNRNKMSTYLMLASLLVLIVCKAPFFDILWPIYLLYFSGVLLKYYFNDIKILYTYLGGFIAGAIVYLIFFKTKIDTNSIIIVSVGSAAYAMLTKLITYVPNFQIQMMFLGRVKIIWVGLILIGLDILTINPSHPNLRIGHLGGILFGFLSIYLSRKNSFGFLKYFKQKKGPRYDRSKNKDAGRPLTDEEYNYRKKEDQDEIDRILEKIKHAGYDSLSAAEKRKLFEKSNS